jgi:hypothetical protein
MKGGSKYFVAVMLLTGLLGPRAAIPSGGSPWQPPGFVHVGGPEDLEAFAAGDLGILLPGFARSYLIVAYRAMIGRPLTKEEQEGAMHVWNVRLGRERWSEREGVGAWLSARSSICGSEGHQGSNKAVMLEDMEANTVRYYAWGNCYPDAFEAAASRLEELIRQHGKTAPETLEWLAAQDTVFHNCSRQELALPAALGAGTPEQRADRDYQLAAAWFYATDFDMAEAAFRAIARDPDSRWRALAPYLVVRCLVRRADFDWRNRVPYLSQALVEIDNFLQDQSTASLRAAATRMRGIILKRLDPDRRTPELAELITGGERGSEFAQNLWDITQLLDRFFYYPARKWTEPIVRPDLIAWLGAFQGWLPRKPGESALDKWRQSRTAPWLVAALVRAHGEDAAANELIEAAGAFDGRSPAWPTVEYNRLRLLVEQSRLGEARRGLETAFDDTRFGTSLSVDNLLRGLRARVARDRADFLEYAVRSPVSYRSSKYSEMGRWVTEDAPRLADTAVVESMLPLSEQRALIEEPGLDDATRERLAVAVWVRAILLRRLAIARQVTPRLQTIVTRLYLREGEEKSLRTFLDASSDREAYREAAFTLLHLPGAVPFVEPRLRGLDELSHGWMGNWWDRSGDTWSGAWDTTWGGRVPGPADGAYPPAAMRARATDERARLAAVGSPLTFLGREILRWAKEAPSEARIPQMLSDLIFAGRYTRGDEYSADLLERAFRLLHTRYKDTPSAADTPYWYQPTWVVKVTRPPFVRR